MRMIVEAFTETLELGLNKPNQIVVRMYSVFRNRIRSHSCIYRPTQLTLAISLEMRRFCRWMFPDLFISPTSSYSFDGQFPIMY